MMELSNNIIVVTTSPRIEEYDLIDGLSWPLPISNQFHYLILNWSARFKYKEIKMANLLFVELFLRECGPNMSLYASANLLFLSQWNKIKNTPFDW